MNTPKSGYTPIALPTATPHALVDPELSSLVKVWHDKREEIEESGKLEEFLTRMKREWAIETGLIERLYAWDQGVTELLIERGLDDAIIRDKAGPRSPHAAAIIHDQHAVIEGLFGYIKGELPLTETFIRQLHQQLTVSQPTTEAIDALGRRVEVALLRGQYKQLPNNPRRPDGSVHAYCPPERVAEEMARLVEGARALDTQQAPPEVFAAWLHHAFTQIHPFQDGNGRLARSLATLVFLRADLFPLIVRDDQRAAYIDALEAADSGNLSPLIKLFARQQRDAILQALGLAHEAARGARLHQQLAMSLQKRHQKVSEQRQQLDQLSESLLRATEETFARWRDELQALLDVNAPKGAAWQARIFFACFGAENDYWFRYQIIDVANEPRWRYFVNLNAYRAWARLSLRTDFEFDLLVSLHGYGAGVGMRAVSALTFSRPLERSASASADPEDLLAPSRPAMLEPFLFNYAETEDSLMPRYVGWLEETGEIARGDWLRLLLKD